MKPSTLTDEVARFLMIWVGLLGAAYVTGQRKHLAIDIFLLRLPEKRRCLMDMGINLIVMIFSLGVIVFGGVRLVVNVLNSNQISSAQDVIRPLLPIFLAQVAMLMVITYVPWISLALPRMFGLL